MSTKNRTHRTTTRNIFPNQMIEQINIALEQKGPRFLSLNKADCRRRLTSEKRAYTSIKSDEEWTSRFQPLEQDDIVNSLNYEGIAVIELQLYFLTVTDCVLALSQTRNSLNDYVIMVISQPPGNNPSYYYRASPTLPQLLWILPETPYISIHAITTSIFHKWYIQYFYTNRIHGGIISRLFFIHFVAPCAALHLAVKILLQIFLYRNLSTLALHTSVSCISLQNTSRTALCYATNTIKWKHS